jgi:hypothetical protein
MQFSDIGTAGVSSFDVRGNNSCAFQFARAKRQRARIFRCSFQILEPQVLAHLMSEETTAAFFSWPGQKDKDHDLQMQFSFAQAEKWNIHHPSQSLGLESHKSLAAIQFHKTKITKV